MYAVLRGHPVLTRDYRESFIHIAFRPRDEKFEVTDVAIQRDPEFIADISRLWSGDVSRNRFVKDFISRLKETYTLSDEAVAHKVLGETSEGRVGIVTPYRAQARLSSKIAKDWDILDRLRIDTVHRFQGGEETAIVLDCVDGPGIPSWSVLDDQRPDSDAQLLLNVALTRAKCKVYLVVHVDHMHASLKKDSIIVRIIDIFGVEWQTVSSEDLIDNYLASDFEKWATAAIGPVSRLETRQRAISIRKRTYGRRSSVTFVL